MQAVACTRSMHPPRFLHLQGMEKKTKTWELHLSTLAPVLGPPARSDITNL